MVIRGVAFYIDGELSPEIKFLFEDFKSAVNKAIRVGLQSGVTSRYKLSKLAYTDLRSEHQIYSQHIVSAIEIAASILKNYRHAIRKGKKLKIPYVKRLMMKAENQAYKLDRETGEVDLPIRAGKHTKLKLVVSDYHRKYLDNPAYSLGSLTLLPNRVIIAFRKYAPKPYTPISALSIDTNEGSLDGIFVKAKRNKSISIKADYSYVPAIQQRHYLRRKKLQKKKAHDRRTMKNLCRKEGRREHNRIKYRLHETANNLLSYAKDNKAVIILEDLTGMRQQTPVPKLNRRLSSWPRRKLHQIIEYKAEWEGIPVIKLNPRNSSRTCPRCGSIKRSRLGKIFKCEQCGWQMDRHINAGINLLQTAISKEMVGGLRFSLDALQHDPVIPLCDLIEGVREEANGVSCN